MQPATSRVLAEIDGPIGTLLFNNPARHNALSLDMWEAVPTVLEAFERDPHVRVIVVRGAGEKAFVAGADVSQFETERATPETVERYGNAVERAYEALAALTKPTIAMISGYCIGGGVGIAVACDIRIAADNAKFSIPAAKLGVGYRAAGMKKLVDLIGPAFAKEIFFTGRQFTAEEVLAMGLLNRVVAPILLAPYVSDYCHMIAANAPLTMRSVKHIIGELAKMPDVVDIDGCEETVQACFDSDDYVEGRRAFLAKRKPAFSGR